MEGAIAARLNKTQPIKVNLKSLNKIHLIGVRRVPKLGVAENSREARLIVRPWSNHKAQVHS